jgi:hypothetical protein
MTALLVYASARKVVAYLLGAFLIGWGVWCFGYELLYPAKAWAESEASGNKGIIFAPNTFCGVIILWGVILVLITNRHYAGGIWTYLGVLLIGLALILFALAVDFYLTKPHGQIFIGPLVISAVVFQLGCYSVMGGRIRNERMRNEALLNKHLQPTPR